MSIAASINDISRNTASTPSSALNGTSASSSSDLQSSFLTLLVAQLKNQDPTNPLQNNELTSQLAQISTLSGIEKLNTTLGSISGQINSGQSLQAGSLIGHGVMIPGSDILAGSAGEGDDKVVNTTPFGLELMQPADKVSVTITDGSGKIVKTIDLGEQSAGVHSYSWDGKLDDGTTAPDGAYHFTLSAAQGSTQLVIQPLQFALVQGVTLGSDGNKLDLGTKGTATLDQVRQII